MPDAPIVVVSRCEDYDPARVSDVLEESLALAGLDGLPVPDPVLLKPNMLCGTPPEKGATTHPAVFSAAAGHFQRGGHRVVFGDSPNGLFRQLPVARACGLMDAADRLGVEMADFETGSDVSFPSGAQNRKFHVARGFLSSRFMVNLPKLKTHGLTAMTGALKNVFGVIPGARKAEFHVRHPDPDSFCRMIADLNALVRPPLTIMDAVEAMEGNGPMGGKIVRMGLILVSRDPVALDAAACRLMGIDPRSMPLIVLAERAGVGSAGGAGVELRGSGRDLRPERPFLRAARSIDASLPAFLMRFAKRILVPRPVISAEACLACGRCIEACPVEGKALARLDSKGVPRYNYAACIRCYCCQEICPQGAILLKRPALGRLFEGSS